MYGTLSPFCVCMFRQKTLQVRVPIVQGKLEYVLDWSWKVQETGKSHRKSEELRPKSLPKTKYELFSSHPLVELGIIDSIGKSIRYGELKTNRVRFGCGHVVRLLQTCMAPSRVHGCLASPSANLCSHRSINLASRKL